MSIEIKDNGFCITLTTQIREVLWEDIEEINAYKKDLFTYDLVCIDIILQESVITITEEIKGWENFLEAMNKAYALLDKNWYSKITPSPFETNFTVLYKKAK